MNCFPTKHAYLIATWLTDIVSYKINLEINKRDSLSKQLRALGPGTRFYFLSACQTNMGAGTGILSIHVKGQS